MPAPQRGPHCLCLLLGQTYHEEEDVWGKGRGRGGEPPRCPQYLASCPLGQAAGNATSPSPVLGPCCGNLAPPGKLSPAGLPTRLLSAPTSLCCSQLLCTFRWPLRPLQGTPVCTRSHQECPRDSSGQSFQLDPGARLWAQLPIRTPDWAFIGGSLFYPLGLCNCERPRTRCVGGPVKALPWGHEERIRHITGEYWEKSHWPLRPGLPEGRLCLPSDWGSLSQFLCICIKLELFMCYFGVAHKITIYFIRMKGAICPFQTSSGVRRILYFSCCLTGCWTLTFTLNFLSW